jgi:hypothetical protein
MGCRIAPRAGGSAISPRNCRSWKLGGSTGSGAEAARVRATQAASATAEKAAGGRPTLKHFGRAQFRRLATHGRRSPPRASAMVRRTSRVVGSAQCKSSNASTTGCTFALAITQLVSAASWRRRNSSGATLNERPLGSGISRTGASNGAFSAGSSLTCASELSSLREPALGGSVGTAEARHSRLPAAADRVARDLRRPSSDCDRERAAVRRSAGAYT